MLWIFKDQKHFQHFFGLENENARDVGTLYVQQS